MLGTGENLRVLSVLVLSILLQRIRPPLYFHELLAKTGGLSIPRRQQVTGIPVFATETGEDIMDGLCFTRFLKLVHEVDWLHGTPVSFPNSATWKDRQVVLADSTAKRFAALVQVLHRRIQFWSVTNPRDSRLSDLKCSRRSEAKCIDPGQAARWLLSQMHLGCLRWTRCTNFLWLSHCSFGSMFSQLGSRRNGWGSQIEKSSSRKVGSVMPLFDEVLLERHQKFRRSLQRPSTKERTRPASGDCGIRT